MPILTTKQEALHKQVCKDLSRQEGWREFAYPDPLSKLFREYPRLKWGFRPAREIAPPGIRWTDGEPWTVGYGFTQGVTPDSRQSQITSERYLESKVAAMDVTLARVLPALYPNASLVTKGVLINMAFNMGVQGLLGFKNTLAYMKAENWKAAAAGMRKSLWAKQVGRRAKELALRIETQSIEPEHKA